MRRLDRQEYNQLMNFLETKLRILFDHENKERKGKGESPKEYFHATFPFKECLCFPNDDITIYRVYSPFFLTIIREYYPLALKTYPECFETGNANDIIKALTLVMPSYGPNHDNEDIERILSYDTSCFCIIKQNNCFNEILRIDLFRFIRGGNFVGGLFHTLKHFSMDGKNLSVGNDSNEVFDIEHVISKIQTAFINYIRTNSNIIELDNRHVYKSEFYKEPESGIYFLKTLFKQKRN